MVRSLCMYVWLHPLSAWNYSWFLSSLLFPLSFGNGNQTQGVIHAMHMSPYWARPTYSLLICAHCSFVCPGYSFGLYYSSRPIAYDCLFSFWQWCWLQITVLCLHCSAGVLWYCSTDLRYVACIACKLRTTSPVRVHRVQMQYPHWYASFLSSLWS